VGSAALPHPPSSSPIRKGRLIPPKASRSSLSRRLARDLKIRAVIVELDCAGLLPRASRRERRIAGEGGGAMRYDTVRSLRGVRLADPSTSDGGQGKRGRGVLMYGGDSARPGDSNAGPHPPNLVDQYDCSSPPKSPTNIRAPYIQPPIARELGSFSTKAIMTKTQANRPTCSRGRKGVDHRA
jgi:hypothetical protein